MEKTKVMNSKSDKEPATRAAILDWIYNRMKDGGVTFETANREAKKKFEVIEDSEKKEGNNGES